MFAVRLLETIVYRIGRHIAELGMFDVFFWSCTDVNGVQRKAVGRGRRAETTLAPEPFRSPRASEGPWVLARHRERGAGAWKPRSMSHRSGV